MQQQKKDAISVTVEQPTAAKSPRDDSIVLKISGEIGITSMVGPDGKHTGVDGDTALDHALRSAVPNPPSLVIVDLNSVSYLSSLGMGSLLRFQNRIKESGGEMRLAGTTDMVTALLRRCRLDHAFKLFPDIAAALK